MSDDYLGAWHAWRKQREERLTAPYGYLSISGLHWLTDDPQRFDGVPGEWRAGPAGVEVTLRPEETLAVAGTPVRGRHSFGKVGAAGVEASYGDAVLEVAERGSATMLRPRRPDHRLRTEHPGTPTYPPSPAWVLPGRLHRYAEPVPLGVETAVDGWEHVEEAVGEVEFVLEGEPRRLVAFADGDALWILFADATSGVTTYGAGRQLSVPPPGTDDSVLVDFNRAINLPCAYTSFTTCAFPPPANRLPVPVEAGERAPA